MKRTVLSPIPIRLDRAALMEANHIAEGSDLAEEFCDLVDAAERVVRCKAILVEAQGVELSFPAALTPAYFYAMTVGTEIEEDEDCDYPYLGDVVRQAALDAATAAVIDYLKSDCGMSAPVYRNPGDESGWALSATNDLVRLTGAEEIGIQVDSRSNMSPWYSTVGMFTEA